MILQDISYAFIRSIYTFLLMLVLARFMGRKAISQMTFFDFVVAITIGSIASSLAVGEKNSSYAASTALILLPVLAVITDVLHVKSFHFRKVVESEPVVVIENGQINDKNMRKTRFSTADLTTLLREKNYFNIADIEYAIIEPDGKLSVLPKSNKRPLTPADMNIQTAFTGLTKDVINDGRIMDENLEDGSRNRQWLITELRNQGIKDIAEVFYAGLDTQGNLYVSLRMKGSEKHGKFGIE